MSCWCCRALVPNVIIDGKVDDDGDEAERDKSEEKTGVAGEQLVADRSHVLAVKQPSEDCSDTADHG